MANWKLTKEDITSTKEAGMNMVYGICIAIVAVGVTTLWAIWMLISIPIGITMDFYDWIKRKICRIST